MKRLASWVFAAQAGCTIMLPSSESHLLIKDKTVHHRLRAYILELEMYGVDF